MEDAGETRCWIWFVQGGQLSWVNVCCCCQDSQSNGKLFVQDSDAPPNQDVETDALKVSDSPDVLDATRLVCPLQILTVIGVVCVPPP